LEKIEAKLENKTKINELDEKILNQIKLILNNYSTVKNEEDSNNFDEIIKDSLGERKSEFKKPFGRLTKSLIRTHERNKTSLLRETNTSNFNFILSGSDKSVKDNFKFYKEDGFLNFVSIFEKFLNQENIHIKEELYEENGSRNRWNVPFETDFEANKATGFFTWKLRNELIEALKEKYNWKIEERRNYTGNKNNS